MLANQVSGTGCKSLTPHSETPIIASTKYYRLKEGTPADGAAMTITTDALDRSETGRWLLYNERQATALANLIRSQYGCGDDPFVEGLRVNKNSRRGLSLSRDSDWPLAGKVFRQPVLI